MLGDSATTVTSSTSSSRLLDGTMPSPQGGGGASLSAWKFLFYLNWTRNGYIPMIGRHYAFVHKLLHLVLPEQVTTHCTSLVSIPMQEQRDLLVLLVELEVDVDE